MITKERLEELIKEEATIFIITKQYFIAGVSNFISIQKENLSKENYIGKDNTLYWKDMGIAELEYLYETKEDAEWYLEFGNITRTETLRLPTWEEFYNSKKYSCIFVDFYNNVRQLYQCDGEIYINAQYCGYLTKENYIEACKLCKKLFLGEER